MIGNNRVSAVLVSTNLEKSQQFYEHIVGLTLSPKTIKNHLLFDCGDGSTVLIYGRGKGNSADHTQLRFWSNDVHKDVAELIGRGVVFEEYDMGAFKTIDHGRDHSRHRQVGLVQRSRRQHRRGLSTGVTSLGGTTG